MQWFHTIVEKSKLERIIYEGRKGLDDFPIVKIVKIKMHLCGVVLDGSAQLSQ